MVNVIVTDEFGVWYQEELDEHQQDSVTTCVDMLEQEGVNLRYPHCSSIKGSRYALRELRIRSSGRYLRVFYAFDPTRNAVLLLGGDKTGKE